MLAHFQNPCVSEPPWVSIQRVMKPGRPWWHKGDEQSKQAECAHYLHLQPCWPQLLLQHHLDLTLYNTGEPIIFLISEARSDLFH